MATMIPQVRQASLVMKRPKVRLAHVKFVCFRLFLFTSAVLSAAAELVADLNLFNHRDRFVCPARFHVELWIKCCTLNVRCLICARGGEPPASEPV